MASENDISKYGINTMLTLTKASGIAAEVQYSRILVDAVAKWYVSYYREADVYGRSLSKFLYT